MRRIAKKNQKIGKGMSSAVILSILIHAGLFLLAGTFVIFTVVKQKEVEFQPPKPVERPKMKLKKPKVKIKKNSKPKPTTRIVTKVQKANMPDIQLPEMSGMDDGLREGIGGLDLMPSLDTVTVFGGSQSIGNDFEGILYDFKRYRTGKNLTAALGGLDGLRRTIGICVRNGWNMSAFSRYYQAPSKLYTPTIMIPSTDSYFGPLAFNAPDVVAYEYLVHYKGSLVSKKRRRIRFWGMGDTFLIVRVNGRVVFDYANFFSPYWSGKRSKATGFHLGHWPSYSGTWIDLEPGVPQQMEVFFSEATGGLCAAMLCVEEEGVEYPRNFEQAPLLPIFKTAELTLDQIDSIFSLLPENMCSVTNGPIFNDFWEGDETIPPYQAPKTIRVGTTPPPPTVFPEESNSIRTWTLQNGKIVEAKFVTLMARNVVLESARGKQIKLPVEKLSQEDLGYLELVNPPEIKISILKNESRVPLAPLPNEAPPPVLREIAIGVKVEKLNKNPYKKNLKVELFSIASEIDGKNFILLDRQAWDLEFNPESPNDVFWGNTALMRDFVALESSVRRGELFFGYMVLVTDERGVLIAEKSSRNWFIDVAESLRRLPVGKHFDKSGWRVFPPRPPLGDRFWDADPSSI